MKYVIISKDEEQAKKVLKTVKQILYERKQINLETLYQLTLLKLGK